MTTAAIGRSKSDSPNTASDHNNEEASAVGLDVNVWVLPERNMVTIWFTWTSHTPRGVTKQEED